MIEVFFCTLFYEKIPVKKKGKIMKVVNGVYTSANIFTDNVETYALAQIQLLCDQQAFQDCKIRVMPDVHPGKVGTIGFTSTIGEMIMPMVVGIDIGCGITIVKLKQKKIEFQKLDKVIREQVPSGFQIRKRKHRFSEIFDFSDLHCRKAINEEKASLSLGTLGSGNHFIEVEKDDEGCLYAAVHSGSRHLGKEVTEYYLREGQKILQEQGVKIPYELTYLSGDLMEDYLHDVQVVQKFAELNRACILDELAKGMKWKVEEKFSIPHNYVEQTENLLMLRKGAISAKRGEIVAIPIHMKAGILLGKGLGNTEWNESAPHGSGRIMNREEIRKHHTVSQFKAEMKGIYCSCIGKEILDEAPFAYRGMEEIVEQIQDTVEVQKILKPIYNFKDGSN